MPGSSLLRCYPHLVRSFLLCNLLSCGDAGIMACWTYHELLCTPGVFCLGMYGRREMERMDVEAAREVCHMSNSGPTVATCLLGMHACDRQATPCLYRMCQKLVQLRSWQGSGLCALASCTNRTSLHTFEIGVLCTNECNPLQRNGAQREAAWEQEASETAAKEAERMKEQAEVTLPLGFIHS